MGQLEGSGSGHDSVVLHVSFVAHDDQGHMGIILDADDLLSQLDQLVEGVHVGDGEDEQETLTLSHVQLAHGGELFRARGIEAICVWVSSGAEQVYRM